MPLFSKLLILFIGIPFIELFILVKLSTLMGFWNTILLVLVTGVLGAALARQQGLSILAKIQGELSQGRMPAGHLVDGLLILAGGIVLLTPGLLTDITGFLLMVPAIRSFLKNMINRKFQQMANNRQSNFSFIIK